MDSLNDTQKAIVTRADTSKPLLVLSGAGTGKTSTLTHRIAFVISSSENTTRTTDNILAITFTNKAAREMRERTQLLTGIPSSQLNIRTFHSVCVRILKEFGEVIGIQRDFTVIDSSNQLSLMKRCIEQHGIYLPKDDVTPEFLVNRINKWKCLGFEPSNVQTTTSDKVDKVALRIYPLYRKACVHENAVDFGDLLLRTKTLLQENTDVRHKLQKRFTAIYVDEFQDTNPVQLQLLQLLYVDKVTDLMVVGDDYQSIYRWREADIGFIVNFDKYFPTCEVIKLEQNYRSTKTILEAADAIIKHNTCRTDKKLVPQTSTTGTLIQVVNGEDDIDEANTVVDMIKHNQQGVAILYRVNAYSLNFEKALVSCGIKYRMLGSLRFYERKEVKDALAYLRVAYNPHSDNDMLRIINDPPRGIGKSTIHYIQTELQQKGVHVLDVLNDLQATKKPIKKFLEFWNSIWAMIHEKKIHDVLMTCMMASSYFFYYEKRKKDIEIEENIKQLALAIKRYEEHTPEASVSEFMSICSETIQEDESTSAGIVTLSTVHAAKGLEFDRVFVVGLAESIFPSYYSLSCPDAIEEERRLAYVALTRAKKKLVLSYPDFKSSFRGKIDVQKSRFIEEIPDGLIINV